jgi:predicted amidohydrolase YtcJ
MMRCAPSPSRRHFRGGWKHELGSIAVGKFANFTVLGADPYAVDPLELNRIPVRGTVFTGRWFATGR